MPLSSYLEVVELKRLILESGSSEQNTAPMLFEGKRSGNKRF